MLRYCVFIIVAIATSIKADKGIDITLIKNEMCEEYSDTPIKMYPNTKRVNATITLVNGKGSVPFPVDENVMVDFLLEKQEKGEWVKYLAAQKKNPCTLLDKYLGEIWHDLERAVNIEPGTCPLPKGEYEVKDHVLDFNKFPMSVNIKGPLRYKVKMMQEDKVILCLYGEFELH